MYREYRDLTVSSAITQCYRDMGARHRARAHAIQVIFHIQSFFLEFYQQVPSSPYCQNNIFHFLQIIRCEVVPAGKCRRPLVTQMHDSKIKFPLPCRYYLFPAYALNTSHKLRRRMIANAASFQGFQAGRQHDPG